MANKQSIKEVLSNALVALAWLSFLACNRNDQLHAPEKNDLKPTSNLQAAGSKPLIDDLVMICQRDKNEIGTSTAIIGPAGGVLKLANHQLVIPAGALDLTVKIAFSILESPYLECVVKPYGLELNMPVRLILSYNGACDRNLDPSALKVAVYNSKTQLEVLVPIAVDTELKTVTVGLERFAFSTSDVPRYGLIKR